MPERKKKRRARPNRIIREYIEGELPEEIERAEPVRTPLRRPPKRRP